MKERILLGKFMPGKGFRLFRLPLADTAA